MISYEEGDVYRSKQNLIFNPVGVRDNKHGFIPRIRRIYPNVYEEYHEFVWSDNVYHLRGDVQLVSIGNYQFIMNGMCKEKNGFINKLWLTKNLVELVNLACEYNLSIGIEYGLGSRDKEEADWIDKIMGVVFEDVPIQIVIFYKVKPSIT